MAKTVLKTFRLPLEVAQEIEDGAQKKKVSQAQYVVSIVTENKFLKLKKAFEEDARKMNTDAAYKKEQRDLAETNFL